MKMVLTHQTGWRQIASLRLTQNTAHGAHAPPFKVAETSNRTQRWSFCISTSSRQTPQQDRDAEQVANIAKGGYILKDCAGKPELIIIATGSEVEASG